MGKHRHTTLSLSTVEKTRLESIARQLGYCHSRGVGAEKKIGNISALMRAIALGELRVVTSTHVTIPRPSTLLAGKEEIAQPGDGERLNTAQASAILGISIRTVQKYAKRGSLRARRFGRDWSIRRPDLAAFQSRLKAKRRKARRRNSRALNRAL